LKYLFQILILVIFVIVERRYSKWAKTKILNNEPYASGYFAMHPMTGEKAETMYKINVIVLRVVIVLTGISMAIIDFVH
jgi:hypothetical protein